MTDAEEGFEQIGHEPRHFASKLFMDLLNKSYMYLSVFIALAVVCLVVVFWLPFLILILSYQCPATSNSMNATLSPSAVSSLSLCRPPISEAHDAWDAFAVAFASLFSVPTNYSANSVAAVTLVTIEFAVGLRKEVSTLYCVGGAVKDKTYPIASKVTTPVNPNINRLRSINDLNNCLRSISSS
jgi:hypothetical protein